MKKLTQEEVELKILDITNNKITLESKYNGLNEPIILKCSDCGCSWTVKARDILYHSVKNTCKNCKIIKPYCVYKHTFPNNKVYIGITSNRPTKRWDCGRGYRQQPVMNNAIHKYGWNNIKHEILYSNLTEDDASNKERELIKEYNSTNILFGYNIAEGGLQENSNRSKVKKVLKYDLQGNFISEYESVSKAALDLNLKSVSGIISCCSEKGKVKSAAGYMWKYKDNFKPIPLKIPPYVKETGSKTECVKVAQFDEDWNLLKVWNSIKIAAKHFRVSDTSIVFSMTHNGKCKGFRWKRIKDFSEKERKKWKHII